MIINNFDFILYNFINLNFKFYFIFKDLKLTTCYIILTFIIICDSHINLLINMYFIKFNLKNILIVYMTITIHYLIMKFLNIKVKNILYNYLVLLYKDELNYLFITINLFFIKSIIFLFI